MPLLQLLRVLLLHPILISTDALEFSLDGLTTAYAYRIQVNVRVRKWLETVFKLSSKRLVALETVLRWLETVLKWLEEVLNMDI